MVHDLLLVDGDSCRYPPGFAPKKQTTKPAPADASAAAARAAAAEPKKADGTAAGADAGGAGGEEEVILSEIGRDDIWLRCRHKHFLSASDDVQLKLREIQ